MYEISKQIKYELVEAINQNYKHLCTSYKPI